MLVRDLIADTDWKPGSGYAGTAPKLSVLLPTFRRGADGMLRRVLDRIRSQTFSDFEVIVIDDASTDGSAQIIEEAMREDGRISCLTHRYNVGLPAVSEYEGYVRARGQYFMFAFDDYIFEPDAFATLVAAADENPGFFVHGISEWIDQDGKIHKLGDLDIPAESLTYFNFIANSTVILSREIIEDIGLYDPHVMATRQCDWDLWRRIARKYPIHRVKHLIGREWGVSRRDSLGHTYPLFFDVSHEVFGHDRDEQLRPATFPLRDVLALPPAPSVGLFEFAMTVRRFFSHKQWFAGRPIATESELNIALAPQRRIVGILSNMDASTTLVIDGLRKRHGASFQYLHENYGAALLRTMVLQCDAVIVVRHLFVALYEEIIAFCRSMNVPLIYYSDDNFTLIDVWADKYALPKLRKELADFKAVVGTSEKLTEYYRETGLSKAVLRMAPTLDADTMRKIRSIEPDKREGGRTVIGYPGGTFRDADLLASVYPAIDEMEMSEAFHLIVSSAVAEQPAPGSASVERIDRTASYGQFLETWRRAGPDIIVHPAANHQNAQFKTANILLAALYLGAVPIVTNEEAFRDITDRDGVVKVDGSREQWQAALKMLSDPATRADYLGRLQKFCEERFSAALNERALETIFAMVQPQTLSDRSQRWRNALSHADKAAESKAKTDYDNIYLNQINVALDAEVARLRADYSELGAETVRILESKAAVEQEAARLRADYSELVAVRTAELNSRTYRLARLFRRIAALPRRIYRAVRGAGQ